MYTQQTHYFLGANTPSGFYSIYDELIDIGSADTLYLINDGFGSGKKAFLKAIADKMPEHGLEVELIHSPYYPDSLDAVNIPALKIAYIGGTAPQTIEARYPVAVEQYIDICKFYNSSKIRFQKNEIMEMDRACKSLYVRACSCISAGWGVMRELAGHILDDRIYSAVHKRAKGIIVREIPKGEKGKGKVVKRFLSAVTHQGVVSRLDTVEGLADKVYVLDNNLGLAHYLLEDVVVAATDAGHDVIICPSIVEPDRIEHIIIPTLSLAFISVSSYLDYNGEYYRHVRLDAMAEGEKLKRYKARMRFSRRISNMLMQEAVDTLSDVRKLNDELSALYDASLDTNGVDALAAEHVKMILDKKG